MLRQQTSVALYIKQIILKVGCGGLSIENKKWHFTWRSHEEAAEQPGGGGGRLVGLCALSVGRYRNCLVWNLRYWNSFRAWIVTKKISQLNRQHNFHFGERGGGGGFMRGEGSSSWRATPCTSTPVLEITPSTPNFTVHECRYYTYM